MTPAMKQNVTTYPADILLLGALAVVEQVHRLADSIQEI